MNFFEQELRRIVEPAFPGSTYVGRFCFIPLGEHNRAKISIVTSGYADHYDTLQMKIINRNDGEIDTSRVRLRDIIGEVKSDNLFAKQGGPHIWGGSWYGFQPTKSQYEALTNTVRQYVDLFQEQTQNNSMQQGMTM